MDAANKIIPRGASEMNVLGFVAFAGGFGFVMWTLSRLMVDRNDSRAG